MSGTREEGTPTDDDARNVVVQVPPQITITHGTRMTVNMTVDGRGADAGDASTVSYDTEASTDGDPMGPSTAGEPMELVFRVPFPVVPGTTLTVVIEIWGGADARRTFTQSYKPAYSSVLQPDEPSYGPGAGPGPADSSVPQPDEPSYGPGAGPGPADSSVPQPDEPSYGPGAIDLTDEGPADAERPTTRTPKRRRSDGPDQGRDIRNGADSMWPHLPWAERQKLLTEACRPFVSVSKYATKKIFKKAREMSSLLDAVRFVQGNAPLRKRRHSTKKPRLVDQHVGSAAAAVFGEAVAKKRLLEQWRGDLTSSPPVECTVCMGDCPPQTVVPCTSDPDHLICGSCVCELVDVAEDPRGCVHPGCQGAIPEGFVQQQLTPLGQMNLVRHDSRRAATACQDDGRLVVVHCPKPECLLSLSVDPDAGTKFRCFCGTVLCLDCSNVHTDFESPCENGPNDNDVGLGSVRVTGCSCGTLIIKNGGCDHLTCLCGKNLCDGCGRLNSVEMECPGVGEWHELQFKCPLCSSVQHEINDPQGLPVRCNGCQGLLIIDEHDGVIHGSPAAVVSSASF